MNKFVLVKEVIDEWDPINLLPHAPDDEYDGEINDIVKLLSSVKSVDELGLGIHQVFVKWFGEDWLYAEEYSNEKCYPVSAKIWNRIFDK